MITPISFKDNLVLYSSADSSSQSKCSNDAEQTKLLKKIKPNLNMGFEKIDKPMDSFVKHSVESAPVLLGLSSLWALVESKTSKIPFKDTLKTNLIGFFVPTLLITSTILAVVENSNNLALHSKKK